jgi:outer membrane protein OmpA-like peptidoglycan-associated protein
MKAKRTALLGMLVCLASAVASAQTVPNNQGDVGLFTMPTADSPRAGDVTFSAYGGLEQLIAGNLAFSGTDVRSRIYRHLFGEGSIGLGLADHWSVFLSAGADQFKSRTGWLGGSINGIQFGGGFESNESRKIRIGTKYEFVSEVDPDFRLALLLAGRIPVGGGSTDLDKINSGRTDWEWGAVLTKGIVTGLVSYQLSGRHDQDIRVSNILRFGVGVDVPVAPYLHIIGELDRNILQGGDLPQPSYSLFTSGARIYLGRSGFAVSGGVNANLDMLTKHGFSPSPLGGIVGLTYAAWPPLPPPPVVVPPPAPAPAPAPAPPPVEEKTEAAPAPAPAPPPTAPPPPVPQTTQDEITFDPGSSRLTNIAKAVLDGTALRMKNDLNSTAVITGYTDDSGSEQSNTSLSGKRADAAKEYLVTRHGIDPGRITTAGKGSSEPAYDNSTPEGKAKNRRALIVVTLVSGS